MPWEETHQARQERLLRQMHGNPRVAYMLQHGPVPHWVKVARQHREQKAREARQAAADARAELTETEPQPTARTRGRHRAPRRWWGWPATALGTVLLLGQTAMETLGASLAPDIGIPI
ncbi:hypothetical protein ABZ635_07455 [Nocardiopsis sp. NPDC007018]|uniref:hypothetical protein n=1 Tax=Nocardiopsis sp. NPDC007018 TaxID=3155721 RepID=UPI0033D92195